MKKYFGWLAVVTVAALSVEGATDNNTKRAQEALRRRHLYYNDVDGNSSTDLAFAISRYQARKGFVQSGALDDVTLESLGIIEIPPAVPAEGPRIGVVTDNGELRGPNGERLTTDETAFEVDSVSLLADHGLSPRILIGCEAHRSDNELPALGWDFTGFDYRNRACSERGSQVANSEQGSHSSAHRNRTTRRPAKAQRDDPIILAFQSMGHVAENLFGVAKHRRAAARVRRSG